MVTLPQVADAAGVSTATAARALGGYGSVRPSTRERVLDTAGRLGYRPNGVARSMITGSTRTLGVVLSDIENPFFSRALRGVSDVARSTRLRGRPRQHRRGPGRRAERRPRADRAPRRRSRRVTERGVGHLATWQRAIASGTPVVLLDRRIPRLPADTSGSTTAPRPRTPPGACWRSGTAGSRLVSGAPPASRRPAHPAGHGRRREVDRQHRRPARGRLPRRAAGGRDPPRPRVHQRRRVPPRGRRPGDPAADVAAASRPRRCSPSTACSRSASCRRCPTSGSAVPQRSR